MLRKISVATGVLSLFVLSFSANATADAINTAMFQPITPPVVTAASTKKVALGKKLFLDPILSLDRDLSCNSCHNLQTFGVDNQPTSVGHGGLRGERNSPSVYNAALHFAQFWDGRAKDVEEQALGPMMNPVEMAMPSAEVVVERLTQDADYPKLFSEAFPDEKTPLSIENVGKAIGAFERTLVTPSRFDDFLNGDDSALNDREKAGLKTFVQTGCVTCHFGSTVGGQMYQKLGLVKPYPTKDEGRYQVTKLEADKFMFKVPSLRNIEKTAPYFHDGSVKTLEEAVALMGEYQLGKKLREDEVKRIVIFLKSLTGRLPKP